MRTASLQAGRSINLALSDRGILALKGVELDLDILKEAVPMPGRMLHSVKGDLTYAPYGKNEDQYINSISRAGLNMQLMDQAEKYKGIDLFFNMRLYNYFFHGHGIHRLAAVSHQVSHPLFPQSSRYLQ